MIQFISFDRLEGKKKKKHNGAPIYATLMETNYVTVGCRREERDGRLRTHKHSLYPVFTELALCLAMSVRVIIQRSDHYSE